MHNKTPLLALVMAFAFLSPAPAQAGYVSGQDLLDSCSPQQADPTYRLKLAECRGYVVAIADASDCSRKTIAIKWDSTVNASQRDLVNRVITWLKAHPDVLHYQADGLVAAALSSNFPCSSVTAAGE
jgi:hypothetical protein